MAEIELPEDFDELKSWYSRKEVETEEITAQIPGLASLLAEQRQAEQELKAKLAEIVTKRQQIESQQDLLRKQARINEAAMVQAKRRLETFASEEAIKKRIEEESAEFDKITQHYRWREFAYNHQIDGAKRLASARRGILGDKRGLGKSLTSLIWADMIGSKKVLIFAPKDVLENFKREIEHWTPHRHVTILGGMNKTTRDMFLPILSGFDQWLVLCNYEAWRRDAELIEYIKMLKADTVIIDEAHNIKEKKTSAYQGIRNIVYAENACSLCNGDPERYRDSFTGAFKTRCSKCLHEPANFGDFCSVKNVLPMTGTAILNKPQDLWTLLNLVDRRLFPSEDAFLRDYCETDLYTGRWKFRAGGEDALIKKLGSRFIKRDKKSAGVKFKEQVIVPHYIEFDARLYPDQAKVMEQIKQFDAIRMAEDVKLDIIGVLPGILRRRQAITWPAGIKIWEYEEYMDDYGVVRRRKTGRALYEAPATESIKMDKAMEIAETIINEEEDRLVMFSQFKEALKELERRFNNLGIPVVRYDGDISDDQARQAQLDFDGKTAPNHPRGVDCNSECKYWGQPCSGYKWQVILCHYKKGGVGLNLNAANQMIILDREWNPGKEDQAQGRIDRLDNTRDSIVHTIHVNGTIDKFMDDLIEEKKNIIEGFETQQDMVERMINALRDGDLL
jgi:SNF2 family DNA or RNA helicase